MLYMYTIFKQLKYRLNKTNSDNQACFHYRLLTIKIVKLIISFECDRCEKEV